MSILRQLQATFEEFQKAQIKCHQLFSTTATQINCFILFLSLPTLQIGYSHKKTELLRQRSIVLSDEKKPLQEEINSINQKIDKIKIISSQLSAMSFHFNQAFFELIKSLDEFKRFINLDEKILSLNINQKIVGNLDNFFQDFNKHLMEEEKTIECNNIKLLAILEEVEILLVNSSISREEAMEFRTEYLSVKTFFMEAYKEFKKLKDIFLLFDEAKKELSASLISHEIHTSSANFFHVSVKTLSSTNDSDCYLKADSSHERCKEKLGV